MFCIWFLPIAFDANGDFKTHRLSWYQLQKLGYTVSGNHYVLSGQTPQGDSYEAFYNKSGKFLFVRTDFWTRPVINQHPKFEIFLSHITRTVTAGSQEYLEEKDYQVNENTDKNPVYHKDIAWPKDAESSKFFPACLQQEVCDALKKQGLGYKPGEIVVKTLKETYTSQLAPDDIACEVRTANSDGTLLYEHEDLEKNIYFIMPQVHNDFWKSLHVR